MRHLPILLAVCATLAAGIVVAQPGSSDQPPQGAAPTPPAEAFTACEGKSAGAKVSLSTPDGRSMQATCETFPGNGRLAARPSEPPPTGKR